MDPISQFIKSHDQYQDQDQNQAMLPLSPLFSSSGDFFVEVAGATSFLPVIPEIDHFFSSMKVLPSPAEEEETKKKHHNAAERMRRRKLNGLFAALSSVLPDADQTKKKQTAPATVEHVINYIPHLRNQVESLTERKKQLLLLSTPTQDEVVLPQSSGSSSSCLVDAVEVANGEVSILISAIKTSTKTSFIPISYVLRLLEEEVDGLNVVGISSSESPSGRLFYHIHLHLEEEESNRMDLELLRTKLVSWSRKWDDMCLWMITHPHP